MELTPNNTEIFAAKYYLNELCIDRHEFEEDFRRFVSVKKMVGRLKNGRTSNIRLLCNHILCLTNVFELHAVKTILLFNADEEEKTIFKTLFNYFGFIAHGEMNDVRFSLMTAKLLKDMDR
jgi:hypothetical protein